jgi:hypothetical protein
MSSRFDLAVRVRFAAVFDLAVRVRFAAVFRFAIRASTVWHCNRYAGVQRRRSAQLRERLRVRAGREQHNQRQQRGNCESPHTASESSLGVQTMRRAGLYSGRYSRLPDAFNLARLLESAWFVDINGRLQWPPLQRTRRR